MMAAVGAAAFVLDRVTKWWALEVMALPERLAVDIIPGFLGLRMAWNRGVNFGLFAQEGDAARWALIALSLVISAGVAVWALRRGERWFAIGAGLLIGGALGNALDRWLYGAVADFLNVTCCGFLNPYAFNVADIAIFAGAAALAFAPDPAARRA
jgi:signal peptidase II